MKRTIIFTLTFLLFSSLFSYSRIQADQITPRINSSTQMDTQNITKSNAEFSFKLFSNLVQSSENQNVFISPTSIILALSLLYNGAGGQTQQEMANTLGFQELSLAEINQENQKLQQTLQDNKEQIELSIANSLWARKDIIFHQSFLKNSQQYYQAEVRQLDFKNPESVKIINQWVSNRTQGKIEQIINQIQPEDVLFLINAIYFKGMWQTPFEDKLTTPQTFYLTSGKTKQHPMMSRTGDYLYAENEQFQSVKIPYSDGKLNFYLFLPKTDQDLMKFIEQLSFEKWQEWSRQFRTRKGLLEMPRFKLEYESSLNKSLQTLGMNRIFEKADFSQMTDIPVEVSEVKHKIFVEVNEKGTEAAAITSIGIRVTSTMPVQEPFRMIVNRPFYCAIVDSQTEIIVFMGAITDPQE